MKSISAYITNGLLLVSGSVAVCISAMIFLAPNAFYAGYGIDIGANVSLVNELKAPAGALLLAGLLMLAGIFKSELTASSLGVAAAVYLSYGLSRFLSMVSDGVPHTGLVSAAALEVAIGAVCAVDLMRQRRKPTACQADPENTWPSTAEEEAI